ncbi:aldo/keto reductase [Synechococcus sp. PCC 7336]|uniref:aldo/keto reductase n=1 Tax=Synechococcus sp. PCC 7336 TaxID=195250 RepID=UPI000349DEA9|nr:aldo/keto reductase [Synechococcus sp. PCC 7336]
MEKRTLGRSEVQIAPILMGTWQAGKNLWVGIEDEQTTQAIRAAVEAGMTTIDTAEIYGEGYSERIIATALAGLPRDRVELASKVFSTHLKYGQVIAACEGSLKNLETDYLDLYQIHWPAGFMGSEVVPIAETMRALNDLKEQGKIRAIGVSNFSRRQLEEAAQYGRIDSLQPPYSLFWRKIERDLTPYCIEHNIAILAYSPMAQGLLTGKFGLGHQFEQGDNRAGNQLFQGETYERALQAIEQLRPISDRHHCTLAQLALAWAIAQPQTCAIAGARNAQQSLENAKAVDVKLSEADLQAIDRIGRLVTDRLDDRPAMWEFANDAPV